jgi:hypothetical protein
MKLKDIIKIGEYVNITNGTTTLSCFIVRVNKSCFICSNNNTGSLIFSFSGRIITKYENEKCWKISK